VQESQEILGLPLVSDLKKYILNKLFNNAEEVNEIATRNSI